MSAFDEVIPGVLHWSARHPRIGQDVHSHYLPETRTAIDPIGDEGLLEALEQHGGVERIVLTNRHHYRASATIAEAFGCPVLCPEPGLWEFEGGPEVEGYAWGDELAPGVVAHEVGAICPDDGALHVLAGHGALAFADGVIGWGGELSFVPDFLMDEPGRVKRRQVEAMARLLELNFDTLLLAHGEPIASGGRAAVERFIEEPRQADFSA